MPSKLQYFESTLGGIPIIVKTYRQNGGHNIAVHEYIDSDSYQIESISAKALTESITCWVEVFAGDFRQKTTAMERLLRRREQGGIPFTHPVDGEITIHVKSFQRYEEPTILNRMYFDIEYIRSYDGFSSSVRTPLTAKNGLFQVIQNSLQPIRDAFRLVYEAGITSQVFREEIRNNVILPVLDIVRSLYRGVAGVENEINNTLGLVRGSIDELLLAPDLLISAIESLFDFSDTAEILNFENKLLDQLVIPPSIHVGASGDVERVFNLIIYYNAFKGFVLNYVNRPFGTRLEAEIAYRRLLANFLDTYLRLEALYEHVLALLQSCKNRYIEVITELQDERVVQAEDEHLLAVLYRETGTIDAFDKVAVYNNLHNTHFVNGDIRLV